MATDFIWEEEEEENVYTLPQKLLNHTEKAFDFSRDGEGNSGSGNWGEEISAFIDSSTLKSLYFSEDWVYISCNTISQKISSQPMPVTSVDIVDGQRVLEPNPMHPLNLLLTSPNPEQDYHTFMYNVATELYLMGNAVIWFNRRENRLILLPSEQIQMDFDKDGNLSEYLMAPNNEDLQGLVERKNMLRFTRDEIIHIRRPNPASMLWGLSPFIPGRKSILFNRYSSDYLNAFYLKQATPGMALEMTKEVNEDVALRQLRSFEMQYTGRRNQRRTLILPKGVKANPISHSLADQKLIDTVNMNRETILALLSIPKHEVSLQEAGSLGSEEHRIAIRNFWEAGLIPGIRQIESQFTKFFKAQLGEENIFKFDLSDVRALQEDNLATAELASKQLEVWSYNEVRQSQGKEPLADPLADLPKPLADIRGKQAEQVIDPVAEAVVEEVQEESELDPNELVLDMDAVETYMIKAGTTISRNQTNQESEVNKAATKFLDNMMDTFVDMAERAISVFEKETKMFKVKQDDEDEPPKINKQRLRKRIRVAFEELEEKYVEDSTELLESTVEFGYDSQTKFVFNDEAIDELEALKAGGKRRERVILGARQLETFARISKTHTDRIMREIVKGVDAKETIPEISKRIAETFRDRDANLKRATVIARTETLTAVSQGQWAAVQNSEKLMPGTKKVWLSAEDERVRGPGSVHGWKPGKANHREPLNGQMRKVNAKFSNGLKYPRDPAGDAEQTIQCFLPDAKVDSHLINRAFKRMYRGPLVTIQLMGGNEFTGTPNHPMLTTKGWVALGQLNKSHKLLQATVGNSLLARDMNIDGVPTEIGKLQRSLSDSWNGTRIAGSGVDFHGDGINSDIEVVTSDRLLMESMISNGGEIGNNIGFKNPNLRESLLFSKGHQVHGRFRLGDSSSRGVGGLNFGSSFGDRQLRPLNRLGLGFVSPSQSKLGHPSVKGNSASIKHQGEFFHANGFVNVQTMSIKNVVVTKDFVGHVYNLSTVNEMYTVEGVITHNCRCTMIMIPPGETIGEFSNE